MKNQQIINIIIFVMFGVLIAWNGWLTLHHENTKTRTIDYEILDQIYQRHENRIAGSDSTSQAIKTRITADSVFIMNADRTARDSLREILNPR